MTDSRLCVATMKTMGAVAPVKGSPVSSWCSLSFESKKRTPPLNEACVSSMVSWIGLG